MLTEWGNVVEMEERRSFVVEEVVLCQFKIPKIQGPKASAVTDRTLQGKEAWFREVNALGFLRPNQTKSK